MEINSLSEFGGLGVQFFLAATVHFIKAFSYFFVLLFLLCVCIPVFPFVQSQPCGETLTGLQGHLTHPNFPDNYTSNRNCRWSTTARDPDTVYFFFELIDIEMATNGRCTYDYLSIKFPTERQPAKFCGPRDSFHETGWPSYNGTGKVKIKFVSDDSVQWEGFRVRWQIERFDYCSSSPCQNGGTCVEDEENVRHGYRCSCVPGYSGDKCELDKDECASNPCRNNGNCLTPIFDMYECDCPEGISGVNCEIDIDECSSSPCCNGGTCLDRVNGYVCRCLAGYTGEDCEIDIDECQSNPCLNEGTCWNEVAQFVCSCPDGYEGERCEKETDECESTPCQNNGLCLDKLNYFVCHCREGFVGEYCETDLDECASSPCTNGGNCVDKANRYECECVDGYAGQNCEIELDECDSSPCQNEAYCVDYPAAYECQCLDGFTGSFCETDLCADKPCKNGATCVPKKGKFRCDCRIGFAGDYCETDVCLSSPCQNGGRCVHGHGTFTCECLDDFEGDYCEVLITTTTTMATTTTLVTTTTTIPPPPPTTTTTTTTAATTTTTTVRTSPCISNPCSFGGFCEEHPSSEDIGPSYECTCRMGYTGQYCEAMIDHCESDPCLNGGTCINEMSRHRCVCIEGIKGIMCEDDFDANERRRHRILSTLLPVLFLLLLLGIMAAVAYWFVMKKRRKKQEKMALDQKKDVHEKQRKPNAKKLKKRSLTARMRRKKRNSVAPTTSSDDDIRKRDDGDIIIEDIDTPEPPRIRTRPMRQAATFGDPEAYVGKINMGDSNAMLPNQIQPSYLIQHPQQQVLPTSLPLQHTIQQPAYVNLPYEALPMPMPPYNDPRRLRRFPSTSYEDEDLTLSTMSEESDDREDTTTDLSSSPLPSTTTAESLTKPSEDLKSHLPEEPATNTKKEPPVVERPRTHWKTRDDRRLNNFPMQHRMTAQVDSEAEGGGNSAALKSLKWANTPNRNQLNGVRPSEEYPFPERNPQGGVPTKTGLDGSNPPNQAGKRSKKVTFEDDVTSKPPPGKGAFNPTRRTLNQFLPNQENASSFPREDGINLEEISDDTTSLSEGKFNSSNDVKEEGSSDRLGGTSSKTTEDAFRLIRHANITNSLNRTHGLTRENAFVKNY